jgi:hypothetical protein
MDEKPKSRRGFASMTPERRQEISARGGAAVPPEKRAFKNRDMATEAGNLGRAAKAAKKAKETPDAG